MDATVGLWLAGGVPGALWGRGGAGGVLVGAGTCTAGPAPEPGDAAGHTASMPIASQSSSETMLIADAAYNLKISNERFATFFLDVRPI